IPGQADPCRDLEILPLLHEEEEACLPWLARGVGPEAAGCYTSHPVTEGLPPFDLRASKLQGVADICTEELPRSARICGPLLAGLQTESDCCPADPVPTGMSYRPQGSQKEYIPCCPTPFSAQPWAPDSGIYIQMDIATMLKLLMEAIAMPGPVPVRKSFRRRQEKAGAMASAWDAEREFDDDKASGKLDIALGKVPILEVGDF
ncbi:unnamed protein product, partial [Symbiodinium necroappetens]